ncbi:MAG: peptidase M20 [Saprospiraceae bacterium]|nr:MAG: peptidase M20 [Saprospiraceae bacterium]
MQKPTLALSQLSQIRKYLHAHPELSGQEYKTAAFVKNELLPLKPDVLWEEVGETGIVVTFKGLTERPHLLFRGDMDALPIEEANTFDHKSIYKGVSHKCGHDGHTTVLLGLAKYLAEEKLRDCTVSLLFQPSEENGAGAKKVLADARFAGLQPDYVFAFHNLPGYALGEIVYKAGPFTAAVRSLIIKLKGKTAHAAEPQNGINPALAIARIIQYCDPLNNNNPTREDFTIVTPIHLQMGEKAYGISAGYGEVHLTLRTWTESQMRKLVEQIQSAAKQVAQQFQLGIDFGWTDPFEANFNDEEAVDFIKKAAKNNQYAQTVLDTPISWGEDFGAISQQFIGAMFGIGSGEDCPPLHHEDYDFPDKILEVGINMFKEIIQEIAKNKSL